MASFELMGYIKSIFHTGGRVRLTVGEYIGGRRDESGEIVGERMESWYVFFPKSSNRHLLNFKVGDMVLLKGAIHLMPKGSEYAYCVNGECIKHFYSRNMYGEMSRERVTVDAGDVPDPDGLYGDFE